MRDSLVPIMQHHWALRALLMKMSVSHTASTKQCCLNSDVPPETAAIKGQTPASIYPFVIDTPSEIERPKTQQAAHQ